MNYTLDSLEQTKQALINKTKLKVRDALPIFLDDLTDISFTENRYYFGVLTIGSNIDNVKLSFAGNDIITINTDSQIIQLFQSANFTIDSNVPSTSQYDFEGCFRGFEIIMG